MEILEGSDGFEAFIHTEDYKPRQIKMTLNLKTKSGFNFGLCK